MLHVLHLVRDPGNQVALEVLRSQAADPEVRLSVVLMQRAADLAESLPGEVYRLDGAPSVPGAPPRRPIDHAGLLDLIFTADTVVTW